MVKQNKTLNFRGFYSLDSLLDNAQYLVKWNPYEAMVWMEEARGLVDNEHQARKYNRIVDTINSFLDSVEKMHYYDRKEFWKGAAPERAVHNFDFGIEGF